MNKTFFYRTASFLKMLSLMIVLSFLSMPVYAVEDVPAKVKALFPQEAAAIQTEALMKLGFMLNTTATADIPNPRMCRTMSPLSEKGIQAEILSFDIKDDMGRVQFDMTSTTAKKSMTIMKNLLTSDLSRWKDTKGSTCGELKEEPVAGGMLFMISRDAPCNHTEHASYHEVRAKCYFNNGRTMVKMAVSCYNDDDKVRDMILDMLRKIDATDFTDLMKQ